MIDKVLTIPSIIKKIDQQLVNQYAIAANDPNPIHTDPNIAQHRKKYRKFENPKFCRQF